MTCPPRSRSWKATSFFTRSRVVPFAAGSPQPAAWNCTACFYRAHFRNCNPRQAAIAQFPARLFHATAASTPAALFPANYLASAAMTTKMAAHARGGCKMLALHTASSASAVCANWLLHLHPSVSATTQLYTDYTSL